VQFNLILLVRTVYPCICISWTVSKPMLHSYSGSPSQSLSL